MVPKPKLQMEAALVRPIVSTANIRSPNTVTSATKASPIVVAQRRSLAPQGKIPAEVAMRVKKRDLTAIALTGTIGHNVDVNYEIGINAYASIMQRPTSLEAAIAGADPRFSLSRETSCNLEA